MTHARIGEAHPHMSLLIRVLRHICGVCREEPAWRSEDTRLCEFRPQLNLCGLQIAGSGFGDGVKVKLDLYQKDVHRVNKSYGREGSR